MNFYKRYMGDFAKKTAHLSMTEQGAYDRMLDHYYAMMRPLPADYASLFQIAKAMNSLERKAVAKIADEYFPIAADELRHNKRADEEIERHEAQASKNRELGKLGGRPRKTEHITESVSESVSETEPNHNPTRIAHGPAKPETRVIQSQEHVPPDGGFLRFWEAWPRTPRKQGKSECLRIWRRKKLEPIAEQIVAHVEAMKGSQDWRSGYDPLPATYLNGSRWDGAEAAAEPEKRMVM